MGEAGGLRGGRGVASRPVIYHRTALIPNSLFAFLTHGLMGYGVSFFSSFWMAEPHPASSSSSSKRRGGFVCLVIGRSVSHSSVPVRFQCISCAVHV